MLARLIFVAWLGMAFGTGTVHAQSASAWPKDLAGSVEIVRIKEGQYRYRIKNSAGKTLAIPPSQMSWETNVEVLKVIQGLTRTLTTKALVEDPESSEQFKGKEFAYSYRIKNPEGTIVAVPPEDLQWKTKTELLNAMENVKSILQTSTPVEVSDELRSGPVGDVGGISIPSIDIPGIGSPSISIPSFSTQKKGSRK